MPDYCAGLDVDSYRALPLGVRVRLAAVDCLGWRYSRNNAFPRARKGLPDLVDPFGHGIDCSSFTAYVLLTAFPLGRWDAERYGELQIFNASEPWSPIDAVERAGVGSRVSAPVAGLWHLTQAWKSLAPLAGGHARLSYSQPDGGLLVLESTTKRDGVGPTWSATTWDALAARYPAGVRAAALGPG